MDNDILFQVMIKKALRAKKLTSKDLSVLLGITPQSMSRKINSMNFTLKELLLLSETLGFKCTINCGRLED